MKAYIKAVNYYLPELVVTNADLVTAFPEWDIDKITEKIGVRVRHIAQENETASDMAISAAEKLFAAGIDRSSVDFVLFCTQSPDYFLPTSACIIQDKLRLSQDIGALDFNQGCSGFVYGLSLAKGLIVAGIAQNILLLTAETYSKRFHPADKGNRSIFGDAAAATLISTAGFAELGEFSLGTAGSGAENLIIQTGGARNPEKSGIVKFDEYNNPMAPDYIYMNGNNILSFSLKSVPALVNKNLEANNLTKDEIDLFIFHQANKYMLDTLRRKIKIEERKFYLYLTEVGNTVSSTIPIAMYNALQDGSLKNGMTALLIGFGVGYSWGGVIIKL